MDYFDLYDKIKEDCECKGWLFAYGSTGYQNSDLCDVVESNQLILKSDPIVIQPAMELGKIIGVTYSCSIALGRKRELESESTLNESHKQKMDNRLTELTQLLATWISAFACENELEVSGMRMIQEINQFDMNIDSVACSLTFAH